MRDVGGGVGGSLVGRQRSPVFSDDADSPLEWHHRLVRIGAVHKFPARWWLTPRSRESVRATRNGPMRERSKTRERALVRAAARATEGPAGYREVGCGEVQYEAATGTIEHAALRADAGAGESGSKRY